MKFYKDIEKWCYRSFEQRVMDQIGEATWLIVSSKTTSQRDRRNPFLRMTRYWPVLTSSQYFLDTMGDDT